MLKCVDLSNLGVSCDVRLLFHDIQSSARGGGGLDPIPVHFTSVRASSGNLATSYAARAFVHVWSVYAVVC